jgi:hypothetical protein
MRDLPRWAWMWGLALVIYAACKALTWSTANAAQAPRWKQAAYLLAWPGMDPAAFLESNVVISCCLAADWVRATLNLVLGTFLVLLSARIVPAIGVYLSGWIGMAGLVLILHFGTFHVLSCAWRGFNCRANPLMNRPLASTSLAEFWGRRWNTAFRDLTHR